MKVSLDSQTLKQMTLFKGLTHEELAEVVKGIHEASFPAGTSLFSAEQPGEVVYIIVTGAVKVYVAGAGDRFVTLAILGPGEVVGEMSVADSLAHSATAATVEDSTLLWISHIHFRDCLATVPALNRNLAVILSRRLRLANAQIQSLAALDLYGRIARQLLVFAQEYGEPLPGGGSRIPFRLTQSDLGDLVGASRGRVNGVLMSFREQGHIAVDTGYRISITGADALAKRCV
jgi:CRP/FNR family cyclic AMP-dependent transcriptional regulator